MRRLHLWFASTALLTLTGSVRADTQFAAIFAAETVPFRSTHTHTFVIVVRVPDEGVAEPVAIHHISWFPAALTQRGLTLRPERGVNLGIPETFAQCRKTGMRVSMWGPYQSRPELFAMIQRQQAKLESGAVLYKPTDSTYPSDIAANCYHAIWQPIAPCRKFAGAFNCGDASGAMTVQLFTPWLIDPRITHDGITHLILPPGEVIVRRGFDDRPDRRAAIRSARGR